MIARTFDGAFAAFESAVGGTTVNKFNSIGVDESKTCVRAVGRRNDFTRSARIHIHRPLRDIEMMRAHIGEAAVGKLSIEPPLRIVRVHTDGAERRVEWAQRCLTEPLLPVDP